MKPDFSRPNPILTALALAALPSCLSAGTLTWDGLGDGTTYEDGGNWGGTAPADDLTTDIAQFVGGAINLSTSRQVSGLDFITGGTTLSGGGSLEVGTNGVTGSQDLTLSGTTSVDLNGTDTALNYTGDISIGAGALLTSERNALRLDTGTHSDTTITLDGGELSAANDHLDLAGRNIVLTANGGTLRHKHARNVFGGFEISGVGQLTIAGENSTSGRMQLTEANTYTGGTRIIEGGQGWMYNNDSFGTGGVALDSGGTIYAVNNNVSLGTRAITLDGSGRINNNNRTIWIDGVISGAGDLTVTNGGNLNITSENNTYTGGTLIDGAQVNLYGQTAALSTGDITIDNNGIIKNRNNNPTLANNVILGSGGGQLEVGWNKTIQVTGVISGDGHLTIRNDSGEARIMNTANTYTGGTTFLGNAAAETGASLGTGDLVFDNGAKLRNDNSNIELGTRNITILDGGAAIQVGWNNRRIVHEGLIDGTGALLVWNDSSTLRLKGANTYAGGTEIQGTVWGQSGTLGTGDITLNSVTSGRGKLQNWDEAATHTNNVIIDDTNGGRMQAGWSSDLTVNGVVSGAGQLTINGDSGTVVLGGTGNTFSGDIVLEAANSKLRVASLGSGSYAGNITGDGSFEFAGSGSQTLTGTISHTGPTTVSSGTLVVDGTISTSVVTVENGATLTGSGNTGALTITAGAVHRPGNSPGIQNTGDYTLAGTLEVDITGTTPGVGGHDQVNVTGTVDVALGTLTTLFSGTGYAANDLLFILLNDGSDAVTGTFTDLAEGDTVTNYDGLDWQITYTANGDAGPLGNDIALLAVIPEPSVALLAGLGMFGLLRRRRA